MRARKPILVAVLAFLALLTYLTLSVLIRRGPDVLVVVSLLVLALFGFGIVGALREPPPDD